MMVKLKPAEWVLFHNQAAKACSSKIRENGPVAISATKMTYESFRCLHGEYRAYKDSRLRDCNTAYAARQHRLKVHGRPSISKHNRRSLAVYEPAKCIKCRTYERIWKDGGEADVFTFVGGGLDVKVGVSKRKNWKRGLET
jgi:hypothetical protein